MSVPLYSAHSGAEAHRLYIKDLKPGNVRRLAPAQTRIAVATSAAVAVEVLPAAPLPLPGFPLVATPVQRNDETFADRLSRRRGLLGVSPQAALEDPLAWASTVNAYANDGETAVVQIRQKTWTVQRFQEYAAAFLEESYAPLTQQLEEANALHAAWRCRETSRDDGYTQLWALQRSREVLATPLPAPAPQLRMGDSWRHPSDIVSEPLAFRGLRAVVDTLHAPGVEAAIIRANNTVGQTHGAISAAPFRAVCTVLPALKRALASHATAHTCLAKSGLMSQLDDFERKRSELAKTHLSIRCASLVAVSQAVSSALAPPAACVEAVRYATQLAALAATVTTVVTETLAARERAAADEVLLSLERAIPGPKSHPIALEFEDEETDQKDEGKEEEDGPEAGSPVGAPQGPNSGDHGAAAHIVESALSVAPPPSPSPQPAMRGGRGAWGCMRAAVKAAAAAAGRSLLRGRKSC